MTTKSTTTPSTPITPVDTTQAKLLALLAVGMSEVDARTFLGLNVEDPRVAMLVAGGFTREQALEALARTTQTTQATQASAVPATATPTPTPEQLREELVAKAGMTYTRGRVYLSTTAIETCVRVRKTGRPEVLAVREGTHIAGLLVYRTDTDDVAVQNLAKTE